MKSILLHILLIYIVSLPAQAQDVLKLPTTSNAEKICFALYTVHNNTLKLTAQLYPLNDGEPFSVSLELDINGKWEKVDEKFIDYPGWTVRFRVDNWDASKDHKYRVNHNNKAFLEGSIKKDPIEKEKIVVCAFTGNSVWRKINGKYITDDRSDIVGNVKKINPDLLFFSGDQVYNHSRHLNAWLKFGRDYGEIVSNIPTVCIPDDHDIGQGNMWGENGKVSSSRAGNDGGYYMPVEYIKEVERAQTSHLPDPYDPTPIERGIGVYYTSLNIGGVDFAIIEDRKFKTGPAGRIPQQGDRPDHYSTADYIPESLDIPGAKLLGDRQLKFLTEWGQNWTNSKMKAILSQTIFAGGAHIHGKVDARLYADLDSNGWPQTGRNKALNAIRKSFAVMIAGDQHLATIIHHGIDDWNDAGYSFCVPSISNYYLRWWKPLTPGKNRYPGAPEYTGEFLDGFNNKLTMHAVANPTEEEIGPDATRSEGFGVITFDKTTREITFECFKRDVDVNSEDSQYDGWPFTFNQLDNYNKKAVTYLPTIKTNIYEPVIQITNEANNAIIYSYRMKGNSFSPKVFEEGKYTIKIGDPEANNWQIFNSVSTTKSKNETKIDVKF